ncbi:cellulose binding domain-containing protein [Streptomyces microflavus]|uniref:cellulose binding domain-containing protein n=1 Tax=Streptomyces microflavus TaxID=1919 RepID=UPI00364AE8C5
MPEIGRGLWDGEFGPMLTYARLCTRDGAAAERLVRQAQERSRVTAQQGVCETDGLPAVAVALNAVLDTAVAWAAVPANRAWLSGRLLEWLEQDGRGHAARQTTEEALAVSGLRGLAASDSELFWWSCVEGLPDAVVARRLERSRGQVAQDVLRVTAEFRERSALARSYQARNPTCRSYAALLDAAVRQRPAGMPVYLQKHVNQCPDCTEDFEFLSADSTLLPTVVAEAVLHWEGPAYVAERRRELADTTADSAKQPPKPRLSLRHRLGAFFDRGLPLLWAAGAVAGMLLVAGSLDLVKDNAFPGYVPQPPMLDKLGSDTGPVLPSPEASARSRPEADSSKGPGDVRHGRKASQPSSPAAESSGAPGAAADHSQVRKEPSPSPRVCTAAFDVTNSWDGGVDANLTLSPRWALQDWTVTFRVPDEATIYTWNGVYTREGNRVTVTPADYNRTSATGVPLTIGLVLRGDPRHGSWLSDVRVDGRVCAP